MQTGLKTEKKCKYFHLHASGSCSVSVYTNVVPFFCFKIGALQGTGMLVWSLPVKNRKRLACDVFDSFVAHDSHVFDITAGHTNMAALVFFTAFRC